jgi:hypothetical protein
MQSSFRKTGSFLLQYVFIPNFFRQPQNKNFLSKNDAKAFTQVDVREK